LRQRLQTKTDSNRERWREMTETDQDRWQQQSRTTETISGRQQLTETIRERDGERRKDWVLTWRREWQPTLVFLPEKSHG